MSNLSQPSDKNEPRRGLVGLLSAVARPFKLDPKQWEDVKVEAYGNVSGWAIVGSITLIGGLIAGTVLFLMGPDVRATLSTPLTIPVGLGVLVVAIAVIAPLVVRLLVRRRTMIAERKTAASQMEIANEHVRFLTTSKEMVEHDLAKANKEIEQLNKNMKGYRDNHENVVWTERYGGTRPELLPAWEIDLGNARSGVEEISIAAGDAVENGLALLEHLVRQMCADGGPNATPLSELGSLVDERVLKRLVRSWRWLKEDIEPRTPDYREQDERHSFIGFYHRYQDARLWILRSARWLNIDLSQMPEYRAWRPHDDQLDKTLRNVLKRKSLKDVNGYIAVLDKQNRYPAPFADGE